MTGEYWYLSTKSRFCELPLSFLKSQMNIPQVANISMLVLEARLNLSSLRTSDIPGLWPTTKVLVFCFLLYFKILLMVCNGARYSSSIYSQFAVNLSPDNWPTRLTVSMHRFALEHNVAIGGLIVENIAAVCLHSSFPKVERDLWKSGICWTEWPCRMNMTESEESHSRLLDGSNSELIMLTSSTQSIHYPR